MLVDDDKLIYLDLDFVSRKYEEVTGGDPNSKITKQEGAEAGIKAFFANAGVTTQESRTYSITSRQMLHIIWTRLWPFWPLVEIPAVTARATLANRMSALRDCRRGRVAWSSRGNATRRRNLMLSMPAARAPAPNPGGKL